ncbi:hypothetical protein M409DRAFT_26506 [Zasmidium cellare ATCC 36951]|uniref:Uncharacterized protein n=1 Tax=Zasmidium cellare ATCC 36951 TaxID=1080233 RepID=A0A6A6CA07_ZASCE|nr:uncharacterized protein M409DRAFT_26506 [Zasmidium cellare ATCC 36951]KAF2163060.1 hypothetical protein M409DRAFT_26506 [Zasmidium cellare ATCC 36951]
MALRNGFLIPDPFLGLIELKCQWVAEKTWTYRTTLPHRAVRTAASGTKHVLAFGLDTFATVKLNNTAVLTSDNMFVMHRVDVTKLVADTSDAIVLEIEVQSALLQGRRIKDAHPEHRWVGFNGDMSRLAVRKAQYHWGWDWGPNLMACGSLCDVNAIVELRFISIASGEDVRDKIARHITVLANGTTEVLQGTIGCTCEEPHVIAARLSVDGESIHRSVDWHQPLKYLDMEDRNVEVDFEQAEGRVRVSVGKPTKGFVFEERDGLVLEDSALDLVAGDEHVIKVRGLGRGQQPLGWTYLGAP